MPTRRQKTERSGTFSARTVLKQATLEEVIRRPSRDHGLAGARTGFELQAVGVGVHELASGHVLYRANWGVAVQDAYKVYLRCSSISMMAAWLPHL